MSLWVNEIVSVWVSEFVSEQDFEYTHVWMRTFVSEWVCKCVRLWVRDFLRKWVCEWLKDKHIRRGASLRNTCKKKTPVLNQFQGIYKERYLNLIHRKIAILTPFFYINNHTNIGVGSYLQVPSQVFFI